VTTTVRVAPDHQYLVLRRVAAEAIGTFFLVLIGPARPW
jgi:hypothetical protein